MAKVVSRVKKCPPRSTIGVLNLQGGVCEHLDHLGRLGVACLPVRAPADFKDLAGLIIPGGESTCLARLLHVFEIDKVIVREFRRGMKIWGTCAGTILLARSVVGETPTLGLLDIEVERNSFGSQLDSFSSEVLLPAFSSQLLPLTFIRAPQITAVGKGVKVLLRMVYRGCSPEPHPGGAAQGRHQEKTLLTGKPRPLGGECHYIAAAESRDILVTVFHPELTGCVAFHRYFARKCGLYPYPEKKVPDMDPTWTPVSWTRLAPITTR